jgi:hypothetical protein
MLQDSWNACDWHESKNLKKRKKNTLLEISFFLDFFFSQSGDHPEEDLTNPG